MGKKHRVSKSGPVWHKTSQEATLLQMPKFNAHACGTGVHGDTKYNRAKSKQAWQKSMQQERTSQSRGSSFSRQNHRIASFDKNMSQGAVSYMTI